MKSSNKNKPHILSWLLKLVETIKNKNKSPETYSGSVQGNIILSVTDWFPLPLEAMIRMITVYIGCKWYMWPDMGHTHQPTGLPYQACIINHCKEWELLICSEHNVEFSISRQVKLYNPETRRNQKYLTGKHPHSQNIFALLCCSLYLMFIFSIYSTEILPRASLEQCIAGCSPACCVPGSQCSSGTAWSNINLICRPWWAVQWGKWGKWGLTKPSLCTITV